MQKTATKNYNPITVNILLGGALSLLICLFIFMGANKDVQAATLPFEIGTEAVNQALPHAQDNPAEYRSEFASLIGSLISIVLPVSALLLLLYIIWGAVEWITSGGDKGKLEKARQRITTGIIGIIIVSATVSLFMIMQQILDICVLNFWNTTNCAMPV